ncbi:MAG: hypothetical protein Q7O66_06810 [Dehalococcoidia bacterium]|nr:hypothetical protein [Dehalococcoidia bacterium]
MDEPKYLHIYGPDWHHDDAYIMGDRAALEALRAAIDRVLMFAANPGTSVESDEFFVGDGEGFTAYVLLYKDDFGHVAEPYTEDYARETREHAVWPSVLRKGLGHDRRRLV